MKKTLTLLLILLSAGILARAQKEYRLTKSTGNLKINLTNAIIEGYNGKEIIFSGQAIEAPEPDERAKGLVNINSTGYTDNTGLGISVTENGTDVSVKLVAKKSIGTLTIKVPENMKVSFSNRNDFDWAYRSGPAETLLLKNLKGEIEVFANNNKVRLEYNTGPMNVTTLYGSVEAVFKGDIKGPVSIISVHDYVDVTLPATTKANIELSSQAGKLYAAKEFDISIEKAESDKEITAITGSGISGKNPAIATTNGQSATIVAQPGTQVVEVAGITGQSTGKLTDGKRYIMEYPASTYSYAIGGRQAERIKGKLNGGGINLIFKSTDKSVYLRQ
ncbi:hypothetical protein [Hufsiella ginkgonis]|uniref:DUF4097 family beta strand repeat protein n=1 Tax=Hufsiella ginkgonis TaxID=2695274 RepID=A0A7K1Y216_9SPHI|nr:hypothetical protein [Hufsiella ginkgonis]MXV17118.1 hypothetical protein [Hufsiella ginkgonis]